MIRHQSLASSMLAAAAYDERARCLHLQFAGKDGKPARYYSYDGVPLQVWTGLRLAQSHGKFFLDSIRDAFTAREIEVQDWHELLATAAQDVTTISWELNVPLYDFAQTQVAGVYGPLAAGASHAAAV